MTEHPALTTTHQHSHQIGGVTVNFTIGRIVSRNPARKPGGTSLFSATGQHLPASIDLSTGAGCSCGGVRPCDGPAAVFDPANHEVRNAQ